MNTEDYEYLSQRLKNAQTDQEMRALLSNNLNTIIAALEDAVRAVQQKRILRAILEADERGQGLPFADAMEAAVRMVGEPS